MMEQLALATTTDGDVVTLWRTDEEWDAFAYQGRARHNFDGHRRRYVFSVDGKGASGYGAVGAGIEWHDRNGEGDRDAWAPDATPFMVPWADANTFGDAETYPPVTVRGAVYSFGYTWKRPRSGAADWYIPYAGLQRDNGAMTDAGRARVHHILTAARDLFLALPDVETELVRNSLRGAIERQNEIVREAAANAVRMTDRVNAL